MIPLLFERVEVINRILVIRWNDGEESYIPLKRMRDRCPCAECSGETDALGNVLQGPAVPKGEGAYDLVGLNPVGYYAVQPIWGDGHRTGIYRFELLKELGDREGA
ncbi:MAG: gamma-butyrobetaine hydroxylase-like domain-containing protein [Fidelibacterota bacterium]